MAAPEVVLCNPVRTAIGTYGGTLKDTPAPDIGAAAIRETVKRSGLSPDKVDTVVMGNVIQAGVKMNPARQAAIAAGLPINVPALSVNRVCGSGAQAIASAAQEVLLGYSDAAIAGGMENMDLAPYLLASARRGYRMGDGTLHDSLLLDGLHDAFSGEHSGWHTEDLVSRFALTRTQQDEWAVRSQQRFAAAQVALHFEGQIVGIEVPDGKQKRRFDADEANRPGTTLEALAKLKPAFREGGTITAGNAPGLNAGAAAMVVAERSFAERHGLAALVRLAGVGVAAVEPGLFGLGPVPAVRQALARAGWTLDQVERFEINEAFAAVPLAVVRELGIDSERVNVDGGAIAHGHPIGATGAVLATRLAWSMQRDGLRRGVVTLCIGGGQGIALALEALA